MPDKHQDANMPPIPDGGLSESMPDWLRRPPAWRTLKDTDIVRTEPVRTTELPEADTSAIDPRTLLSDDDLPLWLRNMGRGQRSLRERQGDDEAIAAVAGDTAGSVDREPAETAAQETSPAATAPTPGRFVPRIPHIAATDRPAAPDQADRAASTPTGVRHAARQAWWQGLPMVMLLAGLLVVAVIVIVILSVV